MFRYVADATCATAVVFPGVGIEKALPLNTDVTVELPPSSHGELGFQCGMGMYRGKVVAKSSDGPPVAAWGIDDDALDPKTRRWDALPPNPLVLAARHHERGKPVRALARTRAPGG